MSDELPPGDNNVVYNGGNFNGAIGIVNLYGTRLEDLQATMALAIPQQLFPRPSGFVGREQELAWLNQQVHREPRLVVIRGGAGVGKTCLALQLAHQIKDQFPDGNLCLDLRGFDPLGEPVTPAEAIRAFLDAFQIPPPRIPHSPEAQAAMYRTLTSGKRMLLLLDNAKDPLQVRSLLPKGENCCVIVTSRALLEGLDSVNGAHPISVGQMEPDEAIAMLRDRLGEQRVSAEPEAVNTLIEYCARLPLALAILAARIRARPSRLPLSTFVAELEESSLDVLGNDSDPWNNLRAVFSWSYRMLSSEAAAMFRFLGLHPGRPDIELTAAASLAGIPVAQAGKQLEELIRVNLVEMVGNNRYALHDLLRAYAIEQFESLEADEPTYISEAKERLLSFYLHTAFSAQRAASPHWDPIALPERLPGTAVRQIASTAEALDWFASEHANLVSLVSLDGDSRLDVYRSKIPWALSNYLYGQGHWNEWKQTQFISLEAAKRLGDQDAQARAHRILGHVMNRTGSHDQAIEEFKKSLTLWSQLGDRLGENNTLLAMSWSYADAKRWEEAYE